MSRRERKLISTAQAAERIGVDRTTINRHIRAGTLKAQKIGNYYYLDADEVDKFKEGESFHVGPGRPTKKQSQDPQ